jgi:hypothetical protein
MIIEKKHETNWNFYLSLDNDLLNLSRYIEFSENNYDTFSIEISRMLFAAGSEIDVIAKQLCKILEAGSTPSRINQYRDVVMHNIPRFASEKVFIDRYGLEFQPWSNWNEGKSPNWWLSYNHVKHQRDLYFKEANLKNVINSLGALLILNFYYSGIKLSQTKPEIQIDEIFYQVDYKSTIIQLDENYYPRSLGIESMSFARLLV